MEQNNGSDGNNSGGRPDRVYLESVMLRTLNPCITCVLCEGYLIGATMVIECGHVFCKSCLLKHLEDEDTCPHPNCEEIVHPTDHTRGIMADNVLQDVVNKVVPNLMEDEARREKEFITQGKAELVNLCVETDFNFDFDDDDDDHENGIRKILAAKLFQDTSQYKDEDITILSMGEKDKNDYDSHEIHNDDDDAEKNEVTVGDSQLKFVYTAKWRPEEEPLKLDLN